MNTRSTFLMIPLLNLLAFTFVEAHQTASAIADSDPPETRSAFDLSKIDEGVVTEFEKAWRYAHFGRAYVEALVLIFKNSDGSYRARVLAPNNEFNRMTFKWDADAIAIVHTHPTRCGPRPTTTDTQVADRYRVPIFTITSDGMYMYDPQTKKITKVRDNLDWLKPSKWNRSTQSASVKRSER